MIRTVKQNGKKSSQLTKSSILYQKGSQLLLQCLPFLPSPQQYNMTICHKKKVIWFRVAKVGTRTIFNVFEQAKLSLDAEQPFSCYYPANGAYRDYFKFAFVRNPWDRLVSCWKDKVVGSNYFKFQEDTHRQMQEFRAFVDYVAGLDINACDHHLRMQSSLIDLNNIDYIGRFENFEQNLETVLNQLNIRNTVIEKINQSNNKTCYREYYDPHLIKKVADIYRKDINMFSYEFQK